MREQLIALLKEHGESYDGDCGQHDGCRCAADGEYIARSWSEGEEFYRNHVADLILELLHV